MSDTKNNLRELLLGLGIGQFNATMMIQYLMIAPATTDPKSPQIVLLVQHIQKALYALGYSSVPNSGRLDMPTAAALESVVGPNWERQPWSVTVSAVVTAMRTPRSAVAPTISDGDDGVPVSVGGPLDFLPDVPGGLVTYAIGGFLLYHFLKKRR